ncbi:hypothetical protein WJX81_008683 [Elliptochloris bilobata]|uniref:Anaphase-promoting complex subunit 2 n=1 Tax=Elliptochloris bilobata TaxID=381761 RepID=A0AAW1QUF0_9CHLO
MQTAAGAWQAFTSSAATALSKAPSGAAAAAPLSASGLSGLPQLGAAGLAELAGAHLLSKAEEAMQARHLERFWAHFRVGPLPVAELELVLPKALAELCDALAAHLRLLAALTQQLSAGARTSPAAAEVQGTGLLGLTTRYRRAVGVLFAMAAPVSLPDMLERYYAERLAEYAAAVRRRPGSCRDSSDSDSCERDSDDENPNIGSGSAAAKRGSRGAADSAAWRQRVQTTAAALQQLGMQAASEAACSAAVCGAVRRHLARRMRGASARSVLPAAQAFLGAVPLPYLGLVLARADDAAGALAQWGARLRFFVYKAIGGLRISQLFDLVVDYPESRPALQDVAVCLRHTSLHGVFTARFRAAIQQRLLHAGAATSDIIAQYVATIRALRDVDPSGVLLEAVGDPIKAYLRGRRDTIRCIVASLTDDAQSGGAGAGESLFDELARPADAEGEGSDAEYEGDELAAAAAAAAWQPDPVDVDARRPARARRSADIISMLVAIYGSKELFIAEYRVMLADKLLAKADYDCSREVRTLELLKLRFGDANLHNCEVMLKDLADSKRLNGGIHALPAAATSPLRRSPRRRDRRAATAPPPGNLSATILSSLFWPPIQEEKLALPPRVQAQMDAYAARYYILKAPRRLVWRPHLGSVDLVLTVGSRRLELTVTPLQAALLLPFQEKAEWRAQALSERVGIPPAMLRRRALFWVNQGVLRELRDGAGRTLYCRADALAPPPRRSGPGDAAVDMDDAEAEPADAAGQLQQEMAVYEQFVMGMLANFDGLPLERIHNMLKMFVSEPPYDKSAEQLAAFLGGLVADEKLVLEGSLYKRRAAA